MFLLKLRTPRWVIVVIDLFLSLAALMFAYLIRFDLKADASLIRKEWEILSKSLLLFLLVKFFVLYLFKIHRGLVRYTSTEDLRRIFFALFLSSILFLVLGYIRFQAFDGYFLFPTSVLLIEFLTSLVFLVGMRFTIKLMYLESAKTKGKSERVLIYGAGVSGLITKRTIENDARILYNIIGFIDDNVKMNKSRLQGSDIFHTSRLEEIILKKGVTQVILAIQNPDLTNQKKVVELCLKHNVFVNKVPNPKSWVNGEFSAKQITKINIEDLLGRKPIVLSIDKISSELKGKIILVSGAAGSIGSGMVKQIASYAPKLVIVLDQAESACYDLQNDLNYQFPDFKYEVVIGDIRNLETNGALVQLF
jgi:FlaA1/EpsC-like NDP-sugar epimerase